MSTSWFTKAYKALGFYRGYNFPLWIIFGGALVGFCLSRLEFLNYDNVYLPEAYPGESYWFRQTPYKTALIIHLATILFAGIIAVFQFLPVIRHKLIVVHRVDGYIFYVLLLISIPTSFVLARRTAGGAIHTQTAIYILGVAVIGAAVMAYINIKRLQVDQHRAWMLRCMFYMSSIITARFIYLSAAAIISHINSYYSLLTCDEILYLEPGISLTGPYEACAAQDFRDTYIPVLARFGLDGQSPKSQTAAFRATFGMALWAAALIHILGVEIYIRLTTAEGLRLRMVAYEKQLAAGYRHPGSGGLTTDKFGDGEFHPEMYLARVGHEESTVEEITASKEAQTKYVDKSNDNE